MLFKVLITFLVSVALCEDAKIEKSPEAIGATLSQPAIADEKCRGPKCHGDRDRRAPRRRHKGSSATSTFEFSKKQRIIVDIGYYAFNFGRAPVPPKEYWLFHAKRPTVLTVFDCFCTGDGFDVFDNGLELGRTSSTNNIEGDDSCSSYSDNPYWCQVLGEGTWSIGSWNLNPGNHNITIVPLYSPYGKGTGFLRVDTACYDGVRDGYVSCCEQNGNCKLGIAN